MPSSSRINKIISNFLRDESRNPPSDIESIYLSDSDRADRMDAAAIDGGIGSTHSEIIDDMRSNWDTYLSDSQRGCYGYPRLSAVIDRYFDDLEQGHQANGSLHQQVG